MTKCVMCKKELENTDTWMCPDCFRKWWTWLQKKGVTFKDLQNWTREQELEWFRKYRETFKERVQFT